MNDIRKAMIEAGLISKKDQKRLAHENRVRNKNLGREGRAKEREEKEKSLREERGKTREEVKGAQERHNKATAQKGGLRELLGRIRSEALPGAQGPRRFHYRDADGDLPFLAVKDDVLRRLEAGELGIVSDGGGQVAVVPRSLATELRGVSPDLVFHPR